ncbi:mediator complex protein-domain-containing protein [Scheffersomyces xylosifermentans]|uniref:mediator complex protein-domain-containing protein n=1 Tax=Scheffersomyces xylosifermentans TaxID=1304137 RepID=UPI00315DF432
MAVQENTPETFIQERLDSLYEIDCKIVSLLDNLSTLFQTYSTSKNERRDVKEPFAQQTEDIYSTLSKVAIDLRKEVKIMDDNIGVYDKNKDGVMILPISVDQKNTKLGRKKLNEELSELDGLVDSKKSKKEAKDGDELVAESIGNVKKQDTVTKESEQPSTEKGTIESQQSSDKVEKEKETSKVGVKEETEDIIEKKEESTESKEETTNEPQDSAKDDIDQDMDNNDDDMDDLFDDVV